MIDWTKPIEYQEDDKWLPAEASLVDTATNSVVIRHLHFNSPGLCVWSLTGAERVFRNKPVEKKSVVIWIQPERLKAWCDFYTSELWVDSSRAMSLDAVQVTLTWEE